MRTIRPMLTVIGLLALVLGLPGCSEEVHHEEAGALLIKVDGQVEISRQQWASGQWSPVSVGTLVADADLLEVNEGSATILCPGWRTQEMTGGPDNPPCPRNDTVERFSYEGYEFRDRGRGIDEDIPYILFPRQALILDERPLLRWHDTGAASYTVSLETGGEPIWEDDTVTGTELRYPNDAPALEVGNSYHLVVQDNTTSRSSLEDATRGTGFRLAAEAEREFIEQQRERLAGLDALDEAEQQLALAVYLISRTPDDPPAFGYWGEAWLRLEAAAQVHDTPAVWRWQGEALRAMRLPNEAEHAYQQALQQAEVQGSMEEQAAALAGLWYVTDDQRYFDEAIRLYEELGDEQQAEALREAQ